MKEKQKNVVKNIILLISLLHDRRTLVLTMIVIGLMQSLLEGFLISIISYLLYFALVGPQVASSAGASLPRPVFLILDNFGTSISITIAVALIAVVTRSILTSAYGVLTAIVRHTIHDRVRCALFSRYVTQPYGSIAARGSGELNNILQIEAWRVAEMVQSLGRMVISLCSCLVFGAIIALLSWQVMVVSLLFGIGFLLIVRLFRSTLREYGRRAFEVHEELSERMLTAMDSMRTIRVMGIERMEVVRFSYVSAKVRKLFVSVATVEVAIWPALDILAIIMVGVVIWVSQTYGDSPGRTLTLVALIYRLQPNLRDLQAQFVAIFNLEPALQVIAADISQPSDTDTSIGHQPYRGFSSSISFENIGFRHQGSNKTSLSNVSFTIQKGTSFAIRGSSGSGKTTAVNLLLRLYEPTSGCIYIDGVPLQNFERRTWLSRIAVSGQDIDLLEGTLLSNLCLLKPNVGRDDIRRVLAISGIADFVDGLPAGLETKVGKRGLRLSGGQRQRLALARALVGAPDILILDEATSAVETRLEQDIHARIRDGFPGITIVVIAHRDSAFEKVEHSVWLEAGHIETASRNTVT